MRIDETERKVKISLNNEINFNFEISFFYNDDIFYGIHFKVVKMLPIYIDLKVEKILIMSKKKEKRLIMSK